jgi:hypothetical protein
LVDDGVAGAIAHLEHGVEQLRSVVPVRERASVVARSEVEPAQSPQEKRRPRVAVPLEVGEHDVGLERLLQGLLRLRAVGPPQPSPQTNTAIGA